MSTTTPFNFRSVGILAILSLTTLLSAAQSRRTTKTITLQKFSSNYAINLEYDSVIISLSLTEVRDELTKLKNKRKFEGKEFQQYFSETLEAIRDDKNYHFRNRENFSAGAIIEQYTLRTIISRGKSKVFNKMTKQYETKIRRTHYVITMEGERHEGYEFLFMNGTIFLIDRISI